MRILRLELSYSTNVGFSALMLFHGVCFVRRVEEQLCWYKHTGIVLSHEFKYLIK